MALNSNESQQISFDDLEFEAEYKEEKKYYTISGKEVESHPDYKKYASNEIPVGKTFDGRPEVSIFEKDDKTYNALRLRLIDDTAAEIMDFYFNFPKKEYPYVKKLNKRFSFYRNCFDFIYSVLKYRDERNVVDSDGEEINYFKLINLETFAKYVDQMEYVTVEVTEGDPDDDYNSWMIYKME